MSLLIDALKRAEEAKQRSAVLADGEATASIDGDTGVPAAATAVASARNLFEVKAPRRRVGFPLAVGGLTTLASLAIGLYFWGQLRPAGPRVTLPPPAATEVRPAPRPDAAPLPPANLADAAEASEDGPQIPPAASAKVAAPSRGRIGSAPETTQPRAAPEPAAAQAPLPVLRRTHAPAVPEPLERAWKAYQKGELASAAALYRQVLASDPHNPDALNGLGAIALRNGQRELAAQWFQRTLEVLPRNPQALAGIADASPGAAGESRLKAAIADQPDAAALHFALGNALAASQRWSEAQTSYFRAYDLDRGHPDYLFNLAVSLDHLGQRELAKRFYQEALDASARRPAAFGLAALNARLEALSEQ